MFKRVNAWLHLWLGLISGLVVFIVSITGCLLVFEQEVNDFMNAELNVVAQDQAKLLPPSKLYAAVLTIVPEKKIQSVWYHGLTKAAVVSINSDSAIYLNPYTAKIIAYKGHEDFFHFIEEGHRHLWMGRVIGKQVVGWATFIFFLLLISGLIYWWPKKWNKRSASQSFKIRFKAKFKRINYDLHNVLGFYVLVLALLMAITGLVMSFPWFSKSLYWATGGVVPSFVKPVSDTLHNPETKMLVQVDKAWDKGIHHIATNNKREIIIGFPSKKFDAIYICTDMFHGIWRDVFLDQHTLMELPASAKKIHDDDYASWIRRANYALHVGVIGGFGTKILYFVGSLICASLPITGFYIWWGKKRKSIKRSRI